MVTKEQFDEACRVRREYLKQNPLQGLFEEIRASPEFNDISDEEIWEAMRGAAWRYLKDQQVKEYEKQL